MKNGHVFAWLFSFGTLFAAATAGAQVAPTDPPLGKIDLTTAPPAPAQTRSYRLHDGFYARASMGFGSMGTSIDDDDASGRDLQGSGTALGFDLMIGGSPAPGVAIGGALLAQGAVSAELDRGSGFAAQDRNFSIAILGPFIDGFPMPNKGFHLGGTLGLAALSFESADGDRLGETAGFGGAAWVGYDFWVADEWSVGPLFRLAGTLTRNEEDEIDASSLSAVLLFTALYH
jgi:hypothetical protein